jgi:hypothetical protein
MVYQTNNPKFSISEHNNEKVSTGSSMVGGGG